MAAIFWGGENFWKIAKIAFLSYPVGRKFKMAAIFWGGENFWKIAKIAFLSYPVGRKFRRNRSISHG